MGLYIEPKSGSKRVWIAEHSTGTVPPGTYTDPKILGEGVVAFTDNGHYDAIAFIFNKAEARRYKAGRPDAKWYAIKSSVLRAELGDQVWKDI